jgi:hypothetical protein
VVCLAPRAPGDSVRPRRPAGASVRPLNFTVRSRVFQGNAVVRAGLTRRLRLLLRVVACTTSEGLAA